MTERLLSGKDYDINQEIKNVEMLKQWFGESSLHMCDVMLKDITDSKWLSKQYWLEEQKQVVAN